MSDRVTTTISTSPSTPAPGGPTSGRYFIVGQTQSGPADAPVIVTSLGGYADRFGTRTAGPAMYDAAQLALRAGASEVVVTRAVGPNPVNATVSLDSGKIVVTAKDPGAHANAWTAEWTAASTTLEIVAGSATETYIAATAAELILAAASSTRITVASSGTLPAGNVAAASLATGTDDFGNVDWEDQLAKVSPDLGSGCIAIPGLAHGTVGQALADHCAANRRHGLVTAAAGSNVAALIAAATTIRGYDNAEYLDLVGPWVKVPDGAGSTKTIDPSSYLAALRASAHRVSAGESAARADYARGVVDVAPEYAIGSADWATLDTARVSTIRTIGAYTRLYTYAMVSPPGGNANLVGGQYRDLVNAIVVDAEAILEGYLFAPASSARLSQAAGEIGAMLSGYAPGGYLMPRISADGKQVDPGYLVEVTTGSAPADNRITALISLRMGESVNFVDLVVAVGDATVTF
jgi:hypothetical protein